MQLVSFGYPFPPGRASTLRPHLDAVYDKGVPYSGYPLRSFRPNHIAQAAVLWALHHQYVCVCMCNHSEMYRPTYQATTSALKCLSCPCRRQLSFISSLQLVSPSQLLPVFTATLMGSVGAYPCRARERGSKATRGGKKRAPALLCRVFLAEAHKSYQFALLLIRDRHS